MTKPRKAKQSNDDSSLDLYLKEIGNTPLVSREKEIELAKRIQAGDQEAVEELTKANLRFVVSVAKQYQHQGLPLGDLINEGNIGLIKATKRFDHTRGFKFISYAVWWIRQAVLQALAEQSRIVCLPLNRVGTLHRIGKVTSSLEQQLGREPSSQEIAQELSIEQREVSQTLKAGAGHLSLDASFTKDGDGENTLKDIIEDETQASPDDGLVNEALKEGIESALDTLTAREAEVIMLYFGLAGNKPLNLDQIGVRFNLTRERIRQIKEGAIRRLRRSIHSKALRQFLA